MSQFKRFNASENTDYDSGAVYPEGTLTWDPNNGLRLHDGSNGGGNPVGGSSFSGNYYDLSNRPNGNTAVHDLIGGASSSDNGKFLQQSSMGVSTWQPIPTTYDTLTINTKVIGGLDGATGTQITGLTVSSLGSAAPYKQVLIGLNQPFADFFNRGSSIIGWKIFPENDPSSFVTITEYLNYDLGGPSLGFDTAYLSGTGPWTVQSPDYNAGTPGPLVLSADTKNWVLDTTGDMTLPAGGDIKTSAGASAFVSVATLKQIVADSTDFNDFKTRIASM